MEFQVRLLNVNLGAIDRNTQREVEMFLVAIAKNPPIMNLDGFTNINRELFTAVILFYFPCFMPFILCTLNILMTLTYMPYIARNISDIKLFIL